MEGSLHCVNVDASTEKVEDNDSTERIWPDGWWADRKFEPVSADLHSMLIYMLKGLYRSRFGLLGWSRSRQNVTAWDSSAPKANPNRRQRLLVVVSSMFGLSQSVSQSSVSVVSSSRLE
jgi:hypothetical protein